MKVFGCRVPFWNVSAIPGESRGVTQCDICIFVGSNPEPQLALAPIFYIDLSSVSARRRKFKIYNFSKNVDPEKVFVAFVTAHKTAFMFAKKNYN